MRVVFEPIGRKVECESGTILEIARNSNVGIRSDCGGRGVCGKCRVLLIKGSLSEPSDAERKILSIEDLNQNYRLACQAKITGDSTIFIPKESRLEERKVEESTIDLEVELEPALRKLTIHLTPPSLRDVRSDVERLKEKLGEFELSLDLLKKLPFLLREKNWVINAVLWKNKLIAVEEVDNTEILGLAVDIGSSKIVCHLVDLKSGKTIAKAYAENPQVAYGEDIVSRISYAKNEHNLERLQRIVVETINRLIEENCKKAKKSHENIYEAVIVGNSVMHHLFFGITPKFIGVAPFTPTVSESISYKAKEVGLKINPEGFITSLPLIAGFVGADASANLLLTKIYENDEVSMVIDIGTNTEVILGNKDKLFACSTPSGPAFEGAHITFGMKAVSGAIEEVKIVNGEVFYKTIDEEKPKGICGSGMIDLVAELFKNGYINRNGKFIKEDDRIVKEGNPPIPKFVVAKADETDFFKAITVSEKDINEFLLAKAAIKAGWTILSAKFGIKPEEIRKIYLAGSFGKHIDIENARTIGLIPANGEIIFAGDSAVSGAKLALKSIQQRNEIEKVVRKVEYVELSVEKEFQRVYLRSIML
ncbi:MAG: ASKHA domain-containing protein [Archaeoglobales archaeon]|nr:ASKHA domain-containing protein [Archaeoglobales archaeon]